MYFTIGGFTLDDTVFPEGNVEWAAPGGNVLYSAIGARIWADPVGLVSLVGSDYPQSYLDRLKRYGFDLEGVRRIDHPNFHVWILHEGGGRRQIIYRLDSGINKALDPHPEDLPAPVARARGVHICPILGVSQTKLIDYLLSRNIPTTLDLIVVPGQIDVSHGHQPALWRDLLALLPSIEEVQALFGDLCLEDLIAKMEQASPPIFAVKMGQRGCIVRNPADGKIYHVPAYAVEVVDATGAGDSFCGGFLAGLQESGDPIQAALCGTVSASFIIEGYGALHALGVTEDQAIGRIESLRDSVRPLEDSILYERMKMPWR